MNVKAFRFRNYTGRWVTVEAPARAGCALGSVYHAALMTRADTLKSTFCNGSS
jgi:hypothetical protein